MSTELTPPTLFSVNNSGVSPDDAELVFSQRQAANAIGAAATTVSQWVRTAKLGPPPWTLTELRQVAASMRQTPGLRSEHGTVSRWRAGCDCRRCTKAHLAELRTRRARASGNDYDWTKLAPLILKAIAAGGRYSDVLDRLGVTSRAVTAYRVHHPQFAQKLDQALMQGRDETITHGCDRSWRAGCRCPECRQYHDNTRTPKSAQMVTKADDA